MSDRTEKEREGGERRGERREDGGAGKRGDREDVTKGKMDKPNNFILLLLPFTFFSQIFFSPLFFSFPPLSSSVSYQLLSVLFLFLPSCLSLPISHLPFSFAQTGSLTSRHVSKLIVANVPKKETQRDLGYCSVKKRGEEEAEEEEVLGTSQIMSNWDCSFPERKEKTRVGGEEQRQGGNACV